MGHVVRGGKPKIGRIKRIKRIEGRSGAEGRRGTYDRYGGARRAEEGVRRSSYYVGCQGKCARRVWVVPGGCAGWGVLK